MVRSLLIRGMLVGLVAGLLMFGFGKLFGEDQVDRAIAYEAAAEGATAATHAHAHPAMPAMAEPEEVSRSTQANLGLFTGMTVYGAAFGGLFALVFACAYGRIGAAGPQAVAALLAAAGFVAITIVPMLKYPASPPAVGEAGTIAQRTAVYFVMLAASVAAMLGAVVLRQRLLRRLEPWTASIAAAAAYLGAVVLAAAVLPGIDEVPADFPASVLWHFRVAALGLQTVMWTVLGLGFGVAAKRMLTPQSRRAPGRAPTLAG